MSTRIGMKVPEPKRGNKPAQVPAEQPNAEEPKRVTKRPRRKTEK